MDLVFLFHIWNLLLTRRNLMVWWPGCLASGFCDKWRTERFKESSGFDLRWTELMENGFLGMKKTKLVCGGVLSLPHSRTTPTSGQKPTWAQLKTNPIRPYASISNWYSIFLPFSLKTSNFLNFDLQTCPFSGRMARFPPLYRSGLRPSKPIWQFIHFIDFPLAGVFESRTENIWWV